MGVPVVALRCPCCRASFVLAAGLLRLLAAGPLRLLAAGSLRLLAAGSL